MPSKSNTPRRPAVPPAPQLEVRVDRDAITRFVTTRKLADLERVAILATLKQNKGRRGRTAKQLGLGLRTLQIKLSLYGVPHGSCEPQGTPT